MLNNFDLLIIGGDARTIEVIKIFASKGANVHLIGFEKEIVEGDTIHYANTDGMDFSNIDAILLPVAGTNHHGKVEAVYSDEAVYLTTEMMQQTPSHCTIYTGTSNTFLQNVAQSCSRQMVVLFSRDDLAIYNAIPTAEGALKLVMEQTEVTVHGSSVMVLGFGRVGKTVARLFSSVGAKVSVAARNPADIARITEMGLAPVKLDNLKREIAGIDTVIHTIPHPIMDTSILSAMTTSTLIIDITSAPGGTDFAFAKEKGIKALHALGLPGKTAPKTAGRVIGSVLLALLVK